MLSSQKAPAFGAEYRWREDYHGIHPYLLGSWATDGATYVGPGLLYNFEFARRWRLTLGSGPGYYQRNRSTRRAGNVSDRRGGKRIFDGITG